MPAVDAAAGENAAAPAAEAAEPPVGLLAAHPALLGPPTFIVGTVALGLSLVGYIPAGVLGACHSLTRRPLR